MAIGGRYQRQALGLGEMRANLIEFTLLGDGMRLYFHIEAIAEVRGIEIDNRLNAFLIIIGSRAGHLTVQATARYDQAFIETFKKLMIYTRLKIETFAIRQADQAAQVVIALEILRQGGQVVGPPTTLGSRLSIRARSWSHIQFTADNGFNSDALGLKVELDGSVQIAVIGHRNGRLPKFMCLLQHIRNLIRPIKKAVLSVEMEMDELRCCHGTYVALQTKRKVQPL